MAKVEEFEGELVGIDYVSSVIEQQTELHCKSAEEDKGKKRKRVANKGCLRYEQMDARNMSFPEDRFDLVLEKVFYLIPIFDTFCCYLTKFLAFSGPA